MIAHSDFTDTDVLPVYTEPVLADLTIVADALTLVAELWPSPKSATVTLETHQWERLRRVLLSIPDLVARVER